MSALLKSQNLGQGAQASFSLLVFCCFLFLLSGDLSAQDLAASRPTSTIPAAETFSFSLFPPKEKFHFHLSGAYGPVAAKRSHLVAGTNGRGQLGTQDPAASLAE